MDELKKYYLSATPVLILTLVIQLIFKFKSIIVLYFLIGFLWPYTFNTPGFKERVNEKKNKYSVLNLFNNIGIYIVKFIKPLNKEFKYTDTVISTIASSIFVIMLSSVVNFRGFYSCFIGSFVYFIYLRTSSKYL